MVGLIKILVSLIDVKTIRSQHRTRLGVFIYSLINVELRVDDTFLSTFPVAPQGEMKRIVILFMIINS